MTVPLAPAAGECASAPNVTTGVDVVVLAVCVLEQAVPVDEVHEYVSASPAVGGVATEGPPVGVKSAVIFS